MSGQREKLELLRTNLSKVILGKDDVIGILSLALAAGGNVLMEDVPGVGKTTLAKALAKSIDAKFHRVQFTPDLLPADILGSSVYNPVDGSFSFREGPIFCNVLLADEINGASPRTQSALLEAMAEQQATIEGQRFELPSPFRRDGGNGLRRCRPLGHALSGHARTVQQYVGRLHRLHHDKHEARVYDYVDQEIPMLMRMLARRLRGYRALDGQMTLPESRLNSE